MTARRKVTYALVVILLTGLMTALVLFAMKRPPALGSRNGSRPTPTPWAPLQAVTQVPTASLPVSQDACAIAYCGYRKTSAFDPGTIQVFLRNGSPKPVSISHIALDSVRLPVWGLDLTAANVGVDGQLQATAPTGQPSKQQGTVERFTGMRVVWARVSSAILEPGGVEEFSAKLTDPLTRPCRVDFVLADGTRRPAVIRPLVPAVTISALTFPMTYDRLFVYLESQSKATLAIDQVELNGKPVTSGLWLSASSIREGDKQLAIIDLDPPVTPGAWTSVAVRFSDSVIAMARVRAFAGFPLGPVDRGRDAISDLDQTDYVRMPSYLRTTTPLAAPPSAVPSPSPNGNNIFSCPMHEYDLDHARCAREILRSFDLCRTLDPHHPCFVHVCRVRPETGYALFAETVDILRTNPTVRTALAEHPADEPPEDAVAHLSRSAYLAARPRPFHCESDLASIENAKKPASGEEFLRRTLTILGHGAKGLFYRGAPPSDANLAAAVNHAASDLNASIVQVRDLLSIADVYEGAATVPGRHDVSIYPLLAADKAMLLFLVHHDQPGPSSVAGSASGQPDVMRLEVTPPVWARVIEVKQLDGATATAIPFQTTDAHRIVVSTKLPPAGAILRLSIEKETR